MMNFALLRPVAACLVMCSLAACGGGGEDTVETTPDPAVIPTPTTTTTPDTSTSGQRTSATELLNEWAPTNPPVYTNLSAIPLSGSADYAGFIFGELSNSSDDVTDSVIGSLTLEASFTAGGATFGGQAADFVDSDDAELAGSLTVSGGALNRSGNSADDPTVTGITVAGILTDDADRDLNFGLTLEGDFLGSAYNAIGGEALGGVTVDGIDQDFDGGFIAEQ